MHFYLKSFSFGNAIRFTFLVGFWFLLHGLIGHRRLHVSAAGPEVSSRYSRVFGLGLNANFTVPVRYFFIELRDNENKSVSAGAEALVVQVAGLKEKCRVWHQLLQIKEGFFVTRFRLYEPCNGVRIDITFEDKHIAESPYISEGVLNPEKCYCPKPMSHWLSSLSCPLGYHQINEDLSLFADVDMKSVLKDALSRFNQPGAYSLCHYAVITNKVYRQCYGQYVGFSMFMDEILLSLARKAYLPDVEMLVNLGDWPLEQREPVNNPIPIFSWCGSKSARDIVMPTYDLTEATLEMMGRNNNSSDHPNVQVNVFSPSRVMLDIFSVMDNSGPPWDQKEKRAFWRGRDSRQERLDLIKIARKHPDKINASLTNFFFFRKEEAEYGPKSEYISFFEFFKHRYQISIDGTVAAYRMPYLLGGRSLVLKQESEFYEYFYRELQPMIHYVPFYRNLSNLVEKIDWAIEHDEESKKIADNALEFALNHLLPRDVLCYYATLIKEYAKRLNKKPELLDSMELVKQPNERKCICEESSNKLRKDEL